MLKVLTEFHHRAAKHITGMTAKCGGGGDWYCPAVDEEMDATGHHSIGVYIKRWQTNLSQRVANCPIYALCKVVEKMPGTSRLVRWWDQDAVNELEE